MKTAVLIPCLNEAAAIGQTVRDFRAALPEAEIYVYDNGSTDSSAEIARESGAIVRREPFRGKGNVVLRMFAEVEADVYVMADGDGTYAASAAPGMIRKLLEEDLDMLSGARRAPDPSAYPPGHKAGNLLFSRVIGMLFGRAFQDVFSGYRVFSKRFVKGFSGTSSGFEIETELTVFALTLRLRTAEVSTEYLPRAEGSHSKLRTFGDGWCIFKMILDLVLAERPLLIFNTVALIAFLVALCLLIPVLITYFQSGSVPRYPSLIVAMALFGFSAMTVFFGYLFERLACTRREFKRMVYYRNGSAGTSGR